MDNINNTLKELDIEDFIWVIYLFISGFALLSNKLERDSIIKNDLKAKKEYKTINITILSVGFFIYLYFLILSYNKLKAINPNTSMKEAIIRNANFVAASLIIIGAVITLLSEILSDGNVGVDLFV